MANFLHTMPLKCERLLSSQRWRMMEWDERGVYLQLLTEAWLEGCYIPAKAGLIQRLLGIPDDAIDRIMKNVVEPCFTMHEDGIHRYNETQLEIYNEVKDKHLRNVENGRKGGYSKAKAGLKRGSGEALATKAKTKAKAKTKVKSKVKKDNNDVVNDGKKNDPDKSEGFDEFWEAYPKKKAKQQALKAWCKLNGTKPDVKTLVNIVHQQAKTPQWKKDNGEYIPHPATWLNQQRWDDEITTNNRPEQPDLYVGMLRRPNK